MKCLFAVQISVTDSSGQNSKDFYPQALFNQALIEVLLSRDYTDVIKIINQLPLK